MKRRTMGKCSLSQRLEYVCFNQGCNRIVEYSVENRIIWFTEYVLTDRNQRYKYIGSVCILYVYSY